MSNEQENKLYEDLLKANKELVFHENMMKYSTEAVYEEIRNYKQKTEKELNELKSYFENNENEIIEDNNFESGYYEKNATFETVESLLIGHYRERAEEISESNYDNLSDEAKHQLNKSDQLLRYKLAKEMDFEYLVNDYDLLDKAKKEMASSNVIVQNLVKY
ncbi:hypothetical protein [Staphylococcus gallinarum]|uniref:hypothetical protein n=1 Tax=Staphylococcus gallinarum TaxID=1293 RepID=UPI001E532764|nr:hypothetical protein [Staphylococcus gallinarum]MCD8845218.1 hypothetical protein [Staphylococcus gallinarum]